MQAIRDEMDLRDETRELENTRLILEEDPYTNKALLLAEKQQMIVNLIESAMRDITDLENGQQAFGKELQLLAGATQIMEEARMMLAIPDTGEKTIGAELAAIELLLQSKRQPPGGGGGGGGGSPGGGGTADKATGSALARLGPGSEIEAGDVNRSVGQATGRAGRELPEEFRTGLDAYFHSLEKGASRGVRP